MSSMPVAFIGTRRRHNCWAPLGISAAWQRTIMPFLGTTRPSVGMRLTWEGGWISWVNLPWKN